MIGDRNGNRIATAPKVAATMRAKLVTDVHTALAVRTDGIQGAPASRTKPKPGFDDRAAMRTLQDTRFPQNEIQNNAERVGDQDCEQRPSKTVHAAAAGIDVDVADEQDVTRERTSCDEYEWQQDRQPIKRITSLICVKGEHHGYQRHRIAEKRDDVSPRLDDSDLIHKAG